MGSLTPLEHHHPIQGVHKTFPSNSLIQTLHWVPLTTSNLIHENVLIVSGTRCNWTVKTLMSIRSVPFWEKITRYSWVLVVTEFIVSRTHSAMLFANGLIPGIVLVHGCRPRLARRPHVLHTLPLQLESRDVPSEPGRPRLLVRSRLLLRRHFLFSKTHFR